MKHWLLSVLLVVCGTVSAQITLVKDGKSSARIIVQDKMPNSKTSAQFLQRFLTEISGVALPIENDKTPRKGDILIGGQSPSEVTEDGFSISTQDGILKISGKENGVVYGVVTLLEQYLGIDYWGENEYSLTPSRSSLWARIFAVTYTFTSCACANSIPSFISSIEKFFAFARNPNASPPIYTASAPKITAVFNTSRLLAGINSSIGLLIFLLLVLCSLPHHLQAE